MSNSAHTIGNGGIFNGALRALRVRPSRRSPEAEGVPRRPLLGGLLELFRRWWLALTLALAVVILGLLATTVPAWADTTFTVNSTDDPGNGVCNTTECTLREAITAANNTTGADTIEFNIPGSGVKTIAPTSPLPSITDP